MDPFSIIVGVGSLLDMSLKLGKYVKEVNEAAATFEEDIQFLLAEIQSLNSVNKSIEHVCKQEEDARKDQLAIPREDLEAWQNTFNVLQDCSKTVNKLADVLRAITGKTGIKVIGRRDGIKKQLRLQAKNGELGQIRLRLSVHREDLNMSLSVLNLSVKRVQLVRQYQYTLTYLEYSYEEAHKMTQSHIQSKLRRCVYRTLEV